MKATAAASHLKKDSKATRPPSRPPIASIGQLKANPKNPRTVTPDKLAMLKKALREFGDLSGVVFNRESNQLVGGHQRTSVMNPNSKIKILREYEIPTKTGTIAEGYILSNGERHKYREVLWDEKREIAANIAANKNAGDWDFEILAQTLKEIDFEIDLDLTMFSHDERSPFLEITGGEESDAEDTVPEIPVKAKTKLGDVYEMDKHRLMCGDSTEQKSVSRLFKGETAELCFTSPPYADQREYGGEMNLTTTHLATFIRASHEWARYFAVNLGISRKGGELNAYWDDYISEARQCGLKLLSWNVWDKEHCGSVSNQSAMFGIQHEWIFVFGAQAKKLNLTVPNKSAGDFRDCRGVRQTDGTVKKTKNKMKMIADFSQLKTIYRCTPQMARDDIDHPARFPVQFPEGYINAMTNLEDIVYEPFGGSGTTLIACEKTGRTGYLMELDPKYCDVIVARWETYTGKKARLIKSKHSRTGAPRKELSA